MIKLKDILLKEAWSVDQEQKFIDYYKQYGGVLKEKNRGSRLYAFFMVLSK
jgi:hypothetical protein